MIRTVTVGLFVFASAAVSFAQSPCERLKTLPLPHVTITAAETIPAGPHQVLAQALGKTPPPAVTLASRCRVAAVLAPSSDSHIDVELWLPMEKWNGKFVAIGNGGWAGAIYLGTERGEPTNTIVSAFQEGYAVAGTNTGTRGSGAFALAHPEKLIDFSYRAVHEMAVTSKAIIATFYGRGPAFSYWDGCSTGGRQGLVEAQRYPEDFDGIVAGAPVNYWSHVMISGIWSILAIGEGQPGYIPAAKLSLLHNAVLGACDALDGVKDGALEDPKRCKFDPKILECTSAEGPTCLTPAQVESARKMYAGPVNPRTNQQLFPGMAPGSELGWGASASPSIAVDHFKYVVFKDPIWYYETFDFDADVALADRDDARLNATDPNLQAFFAHGGKLIQYHGWTDSFSPFSSVNYYNSVMDRLGGASKVDDSYRLFMVPDMAHCGHDSTMLFNPLSALERWRESNIAPSQMISTHVTNGVVDSVHLVCPYPQVAVYKGSGSTNDAANFICKAQ